MANGIELSILIPTITGREQQYNKLRSYLDNQLHEQGIWNEVEIVSICDDRTMSIGSKRQAMIDKCYGKFVVFIDDDDWVPEDYCIELWRTIKENPYIDSIGFLQTCIFDGYITKTASLSNRWDDWAEKTGGFDYVRTPFFPTPILRDIVIQIPYQDMRYGEDHDFARRLKEAGLIKNELFIDKVLYIYQYTAAPFHEKYGTPNK